MKQDIAIEKAYNLAQEAYFSLGVDTDRAIKRMNHVVLSLPCWQGDDIGGFEPDAGGAGGGIQVTGNYLGKASTMDELQHDLAFVLKMIPGRQRINLHSIYGDFKGTHVERNAFKPEYYEGWMNWANQLKTGLDFNATCFGHPKAGSGYTLSDRDPAIRKYWIEHVKACRHIAAEIGRKTRQSCLHNLWIPDGSKDVPVDRLSMRILLKESLDEIYSINYSSKLMRDSVESKLFGIGSEAMTVGSHEFYLAYAIKNRLILCLDNGHFHPTEQVGDKISALLPFTEGLLLHLTRGVRWDSDHVVTLNDEITLIAQEVVRAGALNQINLGLDFFDASINRTGALVVGARAVQKAFLIALLEPTDKLRQLETEKRFFERLALLEELKAMPFGAVWDYYCLMMGTHPGQRYIGEVMNYEKEVLSKR